MRKVIFIPAMILGAIPGMMLGDLRAGSAKIDLSFVLWFTTPVCLFLILTALVWRLKRDLLEMTPAMVRLLWLGSFVLGLVGTPVIYRGVLGAKDNPPPPLLRPPVPAPETSE
jgi:hypothetical protein